MRKDYELSLKELLKLVKSKGVLVETIQLQIGDDLINYEPRENHKKSLGYIPIKSFLKKDIKAVYAVYEDFDGGIKYYIYKEPTKKMRKDFMQQQ